jgi:choline dehydrogenase-like flavoprotein
LNSSQPEPKVDVLIIGAGASAAAFAWSLADTKMNLLCLEQGDWSLLDPVRQRAPFYRDV